MKGEAVRYCHHLMNDNAPPYWLTLLGMSGVGKTMLASRIARLYRAHRHGRINWTRSKASRSSPDDYGRIIRYTGGFINWGRAVNERMIEQHDYSFVADVRDYDFFCIDDVVSEYERHRELSAAKLYDVMDARLGKWTVITANLSLAGIYDKLDARIASRLLRNDGVVVEVDVQDYNLRTRRT